LRSGQRKQMLQTWGSHIYYTLRGLSKLPVITCVGYRGLPPKNIAEIQKEYWLHRQIQWSAWTSTSTDLANAQTFAESAGVILKIHIKTGKDINDLSMFQCEKEILLSPNHRFLVLKALYVEDGFNYIELEEMYDDYYKC